MSRYVVTNKALLELKRTRNMHTFRARFVIESVVLYLRSLLLNREEYTRNKMISFSMGVASARG